MGRPGDNFGRRVAGIAVEPAAFVLYRLTTGNRGGSGDKVDSKKVRR